MKFSDVKTDYEANFSYEELELQHKRKEFIYIQKSSIDLATEKGIEQGREQGLKQGSLQAKTEIIISSHKAGLTIPLIATISGLSGAEVNTIIRDSE